MSDEKAILESLLSKLDGIENKMSNSPSMNGGFAKLLSSVESMKRDQERMMFDLEDIKRTVLNPDEGVIARIKTLESWKIERNRFMDTVVEPTMRQHQELVIWKDAVEEIVSHNEKQNQELLLLNEWKYAINKVLWALSLGVAGAIIKIVFDVMP